MFEPTFVKSSQSVEGLLRELESYENGLKERAATLKKCGKIVGDQDFECCAFSLENSGDSHILLLGGMGPAAGAHGMRDALKICGNTHSITLFQACDMPKRAVDIDITPMLKNALKKALKLSPKDKNTKLVVLCNGAHRFMEDVLRDEEIGDKVRFFSLKRSVEKNTDIFDGKKSVALQTLFSAYNGIYGQTHGLRSIHQIPELAMLQTDLTAAIDGVKSFDKPQIIRGATNVFESLEKWGAQRILLGCTELPVAAKYLTGELDGIELIDPLHLALREIKSEARFD